MSGVDYEELIRSPLDDLNEPRPGGWGLAVVGGAVGLAVGVVLVGLLGAEEPQVAAPEITTTTVAAAAPVEIVDDYPEGFVEMVADVAAKPTEVVLDGDSITVAFSVATKRGADPLEVDWPVGGTWVLESASGAVAESSRVVIGRFSPSAFSVHFPAAPFGSDTEFAEIRLIDRWDVETFEGSVEVPYQGDPFVMAEPQSVSVNQDVTLIITSLELGRFIGSVGWESSGADIGTTFEATANLLDEDGEFVGAYTRFTEIITPAEAGMREVFWSEPFPTDQEGAVTAAIDYRVGVVKSEPASVSIDLGSTPIGR